MAFVPAPGVIVGGKYRLERQLGRGGMAVVFSAMHLDVGRPVALKFILPPPSELADELRQRFMREAQATFALRSEHIVRFLDMGKIGEGGLFLAMELLEGKNFLELIDEQRKVAEREVVEYATQICDGLEEAHARGIVHRDLKPANLFLTKTATGRASVKILDFGVAKVAFEGADGPITQVANPLGTPKYMAPEQWQESASVDGRADLYALGMILFELITGRVPYQDLPVAERLRRIMGSAVPSVRVTRPDISEGLARIIARCLRPYADERFPSAAALRGALGALGRGGSKPAGPLAFREADAERTAMVTDLAPLTDREPPPLSDRGVESEPLPLLRPIRTPAVEVDDADLDATPSLGPLVAETARIRAAELLAPPPKERRPERTALIFFAFALVLLVAVAAVAYFRR